MLKRYKNQFFRKKLINKYIMYNCNINIIQYFYYESAITFN